MNIDQSLISKLPQPNKCAVNLLRDKMFRI